MSELSWNWLCAPYVACGITVVVVAISAVLVRGDRVMRLGVVGASATTLPWALCSALAACSHDPVTVTRLLRLGYGPVALLGPNILLVLLGVAGQLERNRWVARIAGVIGLVMLVLCWGTALTIPGVRELSNGMLYTRAGPLTDLHISQLVIWLVVGASISRRSSSSGDQRKISRLLIIVLALCAIGALDMLTVHGVWGIPPIAWLPALVAGWISFYLVRHTQMLRPQGLDRSVLAEALGFGISAAVVGVLAFVFEGSSPLAEAIVASLVWVLVLGGTWALAGQRPVRVADEGALEQFVAALADLEDEGVIIDRMRGLWARIPLEIRAAWRMEQDALVEISGEARWPIPREVSAWLAAHGEAISPSDLATMRLGELRPGLEALLAAHGAPLIVPLIDRGALVGLVEAGHEAALREEERGLVAESARAAARGLTYAGLARAAAKEGATAREVEVAEAMRLQASASRDDELGRWSVAAEYRASPRTTGAGWSSALLADGRLALMVTEAQAHGVAAALATAALTGAFAAATTGAAPIELDDLMASLRASAEGVMRGSEPIAAFIAIVDGDRQSVVWACAGHPGAFTIGPVAYDLSQFPMGSTTGHRPRALALGGGGGALGASLTIATRGENALPHDSLLVVTSSAVRGDSETRFQTILREQALAGPRLATVLVELAVRRGDLHEDLLAVVVRQRPDRRSEPVVSPIG